MEARARKRACSSLLPFLLAACLLVSCVWGAPQGADELTSAPPAEFSIAPPPAAEQQQPVPPSPAPSPDDELAVAEAALAEADGDVPNSLAGALPSDVAALIGEVAPDGNGSSDGEARPVKALPPPNERQGELISLLRPPASVALPLLSDAQRAAIPQLRQKARQGTATVVYQRSVGNLDAANMACGISYLNNHFAQHFVGLPVELFREGVLCGACVRMWCVDSICEEAAVHNATFMVTDSCNDCKRFDLVVSAAGMTQLSGGVDVNRNPTLQVAWAFESCAKLISGGIKMMPSDKTSSMFLGLQFSNLKALLKAVTINNIKMQRTNYGYWVIDTPGKNIDLRPPYDLVLISAQNQRLATRLSSLRPQTLDVQFG